MTVFTWWKTALLDFGKETKGGSLERLEEGRPAGGCCSGHGEKQMEAGYETCMYICGLTCNFVLFAILCDPEVWKHWFIDCKGNERNSKATTKNK